MNLVSGFFFFFLEFWVALFKWVNKFWPSLTNVVLCCGKSFQIIRANFGWFLVFGCDLGACLPIFWFYGYQFLQVLMSCDFFSELLNLEFWFFITRLRLWFFITRLRLWFLITWLRLWFSQLVIDGFELNLMFSWWSFWRFL